MKLTKFEEQLREFEPDVKDEWWLAMDKTANYIREHKPTCTECLSLLKLEDIDPEIPTIVHCSTCEHPNQPC